MFRAGQLGPLSDDFALAFECVAVSSVNSYGSGIPNGVLHDVVIPGNRSTGAAEAEGTVDWGMATEFLDLVTEQPWSGYPLGTVPVMTDQQAKSILGTGSELPQDPNLTPDERQLSPVILRRDSER